MFKLVSTFVLIIHMLACTFCFIVEGQTDRNEIMDEEATFHQRWHRMDEIYIRGGFWPRYKLSIYWALVATLGMYHSFPSMPERTSY